MSPGQSFWRSSFPSDQLAGMLEQQGQDLEGLALKFDFQAVLVQLSLVQVSLEGAETDTARLCGTVHRGL